MGLTTLRCDTSLLWSVCLFRTCSCCPLAMWSGLIVCYALWQIIYWSCGLNEVSSDADRMEGSREALKFIPDYKIASLKIGFIKIFLWSVSVMFRDICYNSRKKKGFRFMKSSSENLMFHFLLFYNHLILFFFTLFQISSAVKLSLNFWYFLMYDLLVWLLFKISAKTCSIGVCKKTNEGVTYDDGMDSVVHENISQSELVFGHKGFVLQIQVEILNREN